MPVKKQSNSVAIKEHSTKERLVEAAERLFARNGITQVTLEEISIEAGSANTAAVHYHFGSRDELIRAVFERRLPELDRRRTEMLSQAQQRGQSPAPSDLLRIALLPIIEITGSRKRHSYAAFLLELIHVDRDMSARRRANHLAPFTLYLRELLCQALPHVPRPLLADRMSTALLVFLDIIVRHDTKRTCLTGQELIHEALTLVTAIVTARVNVTAQKLTT